MEEIAWPRPWRLRATAASACALILAISRHEDSMNQPVTAPRSTANRPRPRLRADRVAIVSANWHDDIVAGAVAAARAELERSPGAPPQVEHYRVPGAFEIPLHAQLLAAGDRADAIIACGLVVNGGIYRHDFVAAAVIHGLMQVQLQTGVPVFSAVLTPRDFHEHEEHRSFFRAHLVRKGTEVALACRDTLDALALLQPADN
jgi:6,7-dimethyl-8-ribityllumazine synthase